MASAVKIKRDGGKVWLDGVQGYDSGQFGSSVQGAQARVCAAIGEGPTYQQLICYAGLAFRIQVHDAMCPSAAHPGPGFTCIEGGNRAMPWNSPFFDAFPWSQQADVGAKRAEACAAIAQSIDRGIPVHYGSEEDGLIIGYADQGRRWWCQHPYHQGGREAFWYDEGSGFGGGKDKWPWGIAVYTGPKSPDQRVPQRGLAQAAIRQAVEMWSAGKRGDYFVGETAWPHWLEWLSRAIDDQGDIKGGTQGNGWMFDMLIQCRRAAAAWLREAAGDFEPPARQGMLEAASQYERLVQTCMDGLKCPWDLAMGPGQFEKWTPDLRRELLRRLELARQCDTTAAAALTAAC